MRWRAALRKEVVDLTTAETIGAVKGLVIDVETGTISALLVGELVLDWGDADGIGRSVVTVERADLLREPRSPAERAALEGTSSPVSKPVYTEDGFAIGTVGDVEFDAVSGRIERLLLGGDAVGGGRLMGVGSYAVVVASTDRSARAGGLEGLTLAELHGIAEERGTPERATMTREALIAALS